MSLSIRTLTVVLVSSLFLATSLAPNLKGQPTDNRLPTIAGRALALVKARRAESQLHPAGHRVIGRRNLVRIGGVLSQAATLRDANGDPISLTVELASDPNHPDHLVVRQPGSSTPNHYAIPYSDLVPMTLFVDSGGTSLYTLWDSDNDRLPPLFQQDAGFVDHHLTGLIALEFYGTPYADALFFLDTCQGCIQPADDSLTEIVDAMNRTNSAEPTVELSEEDADQIDGTYINTDLDLPFGLQVRNGTVTVIGQIARLDPEITDGRLVIAAAERVVRPERLLGSIQDSIGRIQSEVRQAVVEAILTADDLQEVDDDLQSFQAAATMSSRMLLHEALLEEELQNVLFLFETLALLRTAKASFPDSWSAFVASLASAPVADEHPEPWQRYVDSFCSLYRSHASCER